MREPCAIPAQKDLAMHKLALALLLSAAVVAPALAQKPEEAKKEAAKVNIPKDTFFKGQTASQYLARERLIGAKVVNKDGQAVGTVDDLILSQGGQIEGVVVGVGGVLGVGAKPTNVRSSALKIATSGGKTTITIPNATKEKLGTPEYSKTASQYLARERLIGAKVANKDGQAVGTVDDLIMSQGGQIEGVLMGVGGVLGVGAKQIGVRSSALKIAPSDGKATITLANATKEVLDAVGAYQRPTSGKK
jgi:sporulation protein YlmC with PRC-barrel domain